MGRRGSLLVASCLGLSCLALASDFEDIELGILTERIVVPRPSEPQAIYTIIQVKIGKSGNPIAVNTRYSSAAGWSYTKREYDCRGSKMRTLGSHDTYKQMLKSAGDPTWAPLVSGSSAQMVGAVVCSLPDR